METVTISKKEYNELFDRKLRYEYLRQIIEEDIFAPPPTKKIEEIINAFKQTKHYKKEFLKSLEKGLRRSSYFKK
ncbi:MAG: hypothetical protein HY096_06045 [Nitrospinae bacterium]|nr:hypothetical protein [Nitrospinota bacterium]